MRRSPILLATVHTELKSYRQAPLGKRQSSSNRRRRGIVTTGACGRKNKFSGTTSKQRRFPRVFKLFAGSIGRALADGTAVHIQKVTKNTCRKMDWPYRRNTVEPTVTRNTQPRLGTVHRTSSSLTNLNVFSVSMATIPATPTSCGEAACST
jgi:hypothetical protein